MARRRRRATNNQGNDEKGCYTCIYLLRSLMVVAAALFVLAKMSRLPLSLPEVVTRTTTTTTTTATTTTKAQQADNNKEQLTYSTTTTTTPNNILTTTCHNNKPVLTKQNNLTSFIGSVLDGLNQVVVGVRPIQYIADQYDTIQNTIPNGNWLEFGVHTGNSLKLCYNKIRTSTNFVGGKVFGFDSFEGLPVSWREQFDAGQFATNYDAVRANMPKEITLYRGWFQDTIPTYIREHHPPNHQDNNPPLAFVHHDGDLFVSTAITFSLLSGNKLIRPGTILCFDELVGYPGFEQHEILSLYLWMHQYNAKLCPLAFREPYDTPSKRAGVPELHGHSQSACYQVLEIMD